MSFYFTITTTEEITFGALTARLSHQHVQTNPVLDADETIEGCKVFIPGKSVRGVTLVFEDGSYSVGLNVVSTAIEYRLAVEIAAAIAQLTGSEIMPEDREEAVTADYLQEHYGDDWMATHLHAGMEIVSEKVQMEGETIALGCCYMQYHIGPYVNSLLDASSPEAYFDSMTRHICETQFFDREIYQVPHILRVTDPTTDETKRIALLFPFGGQLIPSCDLLALDSGSERLDFPFELIHELVDDKFTRLDEEQYLLRGITDEENAAIFARAKALMNARPAAVQQVPTATKATVPSAEGGKKWWKFW